MGWTPMSMRARMRAVGEQQHQELIERVRALMDGQHINQAGLARKSGIGEKTISRLMRGVGDPELATVQAVADALGVTAGELWGDLRAPEETDQLARIDERLARLEDLLAGLLGDEQTSLSDQIRTAIQRALSQLAELAEPPPRTDDLAPPRRESSTRPPAA